MNKTFKRVLCLALTVCLLVSAMAILASCKKKNPDAVVKDEYTYNSWSTALGNNWNPHTWETNADSSILGFITSPFVTLAPKDTENGIYQWVYEMATSITDVTAQNQADLTKYACSLPKDTAASDVTSGYVYEIRLNPDAKWENGVAINADTYIYSMKQLLDSKMRNYRANLYISGESAVAGGLAFYNSEAPIYAPVVPPYGENDTPDYSLDLSDKQIFINITTTGMTLAGYSFEEIAYDYGYIRDAYEYEMDWLEDENGTHVWDEEAQEYVEAPEGTTGTHKYGVVLDEEGKPVYKLDENGEKIQTLFGLTYLNELDEATNVYGYIPVTAENYDKVIYVMDQYLSAFGMSIYAMGFVEAEDGQYVWDEEAQDYVKAPEGTVGTHNYDFITDENGDLVVDDTLYREFVFYYAGIGEKVEYDSVGCYKVDDYTIRYVCQNAIDINYFLTSCTDTWLVYEPLYEAGKKEEGGLIVTNYCTSKETSMSYGTYKISSFEDDKQVVYVQNENWYGFTKLENGELYSETNFEVDGKKHQQYQTTKIVIDVMDEQVANQKFFKGELMEYSPTAAELSKFALSDRLYKEDETYTMSFFFNTGLDTLTALDDSGVNTNSVVLTNDNFRKAMSLAINRADYVTVTQAWTPAYSLMNKLYHYDIYNDPYSSYRSSEPAMQAICNLYGVKYGEGELYATLEEAYKSITGYNLTEAKALMKTACDELVEAGIYTAGEPIKIQIGWAKGALQEDDNKQVAKLNEYINAALAGSGFGTITFEAIGNIEDRYADVPAGKFAIGYGAWGGAAFYPFRNFQTYMDPDQYGVNELGCWDPTTEELTLTVDGKDYTMTWQEWSNSMIGTAEFADDSMETKLEITAMLEEAYLKLYYRIPLAGTTICSLLSYKADYYTQNYNIMYGYGGLRLMTYNYTDAEWAAYVADQGGVLNYT
ncbi:MAG: hypothetical protein IKL79_01980 [Clostridia bacterium]|nr:hypothetical protein [Clostridia bacterium]